MSRSALVGVLYSFLSAFLWATVYVATRFIMKGENGEVDPVTLSFLRFSAGGAVLLAIHRLTNRGNAFRLTVRSSLNIVLLSLFSFVGMSVFLFWGQKYTTAINSSMIMSSSPVFTMLLGLLIGERITGGQAAGMALSTLGCMMVIEIVTVEGFQYSANGFLGDFLVLLASFSWALAAILAKRIVTPGNDLAVTGWSMLSAAAALGVIELFRVDSIVMPTTNAVWLLTAYIALLPTALGFYAWNAALSRISLNVVNVMQYLTPIMTVALACLLLGETLNPIKLLGIALVLGGVILSAGFKHRKRSGKNPGKGGSTAAPFPAPAATGKAAAGD